MQLGLLDLPWWGCVLITLGLTHVTIASVTNYLHRYQAHRTLPLHPNASRSWQWLTTGMVTKEWVAIHRKHHATTEPACERDPGIEGLLSAGQALLAKGCEGTAGERERTVLHQGLRSSKVLSTIYSMRQELTSLPSRATASKEQLVKQLEDWCRRAEESGIGALREFSRTLRCYSSPLGDRK